MLKTTVFAGSVAAICASVAIGAQSPSGQQSQTPPSSAASSDTRASGTTATLVGCVYREQDIPGRTPNVAEKVGVMEDYILADAKPSATSASAGTTAEPGTSATTGTSGTVAAGGKMYKLEHASDEVLGSFVGKRVEVVGRIDREAGDTTGTSGTATAEDKSAGPDRIELAEFEVTSIKEASGTCPARPSSAK